MYLNYFLKLYYFLIFVLIPCIGTIFLYPYRSPASVPFSCINTDFLYQYYFSNSNTTVLITYHAITWFLLVITWHLFDITYHLSPDILPLDLWLSYFRNHVLLSCIYTVKYIFSTQWYQLCCATQTFGSIWGSPSIWGDHWLPNSCYIHEGAYNKTHLLYACGQFRNTSNGTPWVVVLGMYGTHYKHYRLFHHQFSIITSAYSYVCVLGC